MKVAAADQHRLLDLVEIDKTILRLNHQRTTLPEHEQIKARMVDYRALSEKLVEANTRLSDAKAELDRIEADLGPAQVRLEKNRTISQDGSVNDAKALQAILDEIDHLTGRIAKLEDQQLEAMEAVDVATQRRDSVVGEQQTIETEVRSMMASRDTKTKEIDQAIDKEKAKRAALGRALNPQLVQAYVKIAKQRGDVGAGELVNGICTGCGLALNPTDLARIAAAHADEVIRCEECGRILVRR